jgi:hypothetical protein
MDNINIKENLIIQLQTLKEETLMFFEKCDQYLDNNKPKDRDFFSYMNYWNALSNDLQSEGYNIISRFIPIIQRIADISKKSLLLNTADITEISVLFKKISALIRLRNYHYSEADVLHDEGTILGYKPASQEEYDTVTQKMLKIR